MAKRSGVGCEERAGPLPAFVKGELALRDAVAFAGCGVLSFPGPMAVRLGPDARLLAAIARVRSDVELLQAWQGGGPHRIDWPDATL